ncbi:MAG: ferredoxin--NADP reductase [bacterium]
MRDDLWTRARVTDRIDWAEGLLTLRLDVGLEFRAGQFVSIGLPGERGERVHRHLSIASAPGERLEFFGVRADDGEPGPDLADLRVDDALWVHRDPQGTFTLDRVPDAATLWLVATGTGLAPYVSMLRTEEPWPRFGRIVVVHGVRRLADRAYAGEIARRSAEHGGHLVQVFAVSREEPGPGVFAGRVTDALAQDRLAELAGTELGQDSSHVMLCGHPAMIEEMEALLAQRGFRRNRRSSPGQVTAERSW